LYDALTYIALLSGVLPLSILVIRYKSVLVKGHIMPFIYLTATATAYEFFCSLLLNVNSSYWSQAYSLFELCTIYYFYNKTFQRKYKSLFILSFVVLVVTYCVSAFFWTSTNSLLAKAINKLPITVFVLGFSFMWVKDLFGEMAIDAPQNSSTFYFITGLSMYYSITFLLFLFGYYIANSSDYFYDFWVINIIATIILRICLTVGVWKMKPN